jgi:hypothetical protein
VKVIYNTSTKEVVGDGRIAAAPAGHGALDAPANYKDYPRYFWKYDGVGEIILKTGAELDAANAQKDGEVVNLLVEQYARHLLNPTNQGKIEEVVDLCVQAIKIVLVDGSSLTQDQKDRFNLVYDTCSPHFKLQLDDVTQGDADKMAVPKAAARQAETDMKNDPNWPV